jgi:hypothetical protein
MSDQLMYGVNKIHAMYFLKIATGSYLQKFNDTGKVILMYLKNYNPHLYNVFTTYWECHLNRVNSRDFR